ncbi:MAG: amino acid adenylation domain-containing protein, partial [Candidatus Aminicenantes bacterium]
FWDSAPAALQQLVPFFAEVGNYKKKSKLRLVFLSGDWIPVTLPDILKETFAGVKVISLGGATEATIWSNYYPIQPVDPTWNSIPYGKPIQNAKYYILDRDLNICLLGVAGDLYIGGECLALAYINDVLLTASKFIDNPFIPGEKIYKTGDIARWFEDGNMEFLGRKDHQVKIRGFRIELGEIESQLVKYKEIEEGIVIVKENNGNKYLCAYYVSNCEIDREELRKYLLRELPEYMLPSYFVPLAEIPLSPNGKVNRKALPEPEIIPEDEYIAPRNEMEETLVKIWAKVLGIEETITGIDANFFELGGHSLNSTTVLSKIHKELNVKVPLKEFFRGPTIRELSGYIKKQTQEKYASIENAEKKDYYILSSAQRRLFVLQQLEPANVGYNIPQVNIIEGNLEVETVDVAFREMIDRHEVLRTAIETIDGEPVQRIYETVDFKIIYQETDEEKAKEIFNTFVRPFDLSNAPFLRVELIKIGAARHVLLFDMHHIISDGISNQLFLNQLFSLYAGRLLSSLPIQYKDYAQWQNSKKQREKIAQQQDYWVNEFAGEIPVLNLPTDYPRPSIQSFEGSSIDFTLKPGDKATLIRIAKAEGGTLFMVLLAIYNILLAKLTGEGDIVVGTPIAGRKHPDLENLIGMFVNTLVLRNYPIGTKTFKTFLKELKNRTLMSFENQDYQFEELVEQVAVNRDMSRNPLFDVMFTLQNIKIQMDQDLDIESDLKVLPYENNNTTSKFDLTLTAMEGNNELFFTIEYCTKLFKKETIQRFIRYFKSITRTVIQDPNQLLSEIDILSSEEKNRLLVEFNDTEAEYPKEKTIRGLFAEQVERSPDSTAVIGAEHGVRGREVTLTYRELNEKSGLLAQLLQKKGVKADTIVGLMINRSLEMIIGLMATLESGGAYLPIDPDYPGERIRYMLADSSAKILLAAPGTHGKVKAEVQEGLIEIIDISNPSVFSTLTSTSNCRVSSRNLVYVIYTSGTTGKPKGIMIQHQSLVNRLHWMQRKYPLHKGDTILQKTSFTFDVSLWELFWWAIAGAKVCLLTPGGEKDPEIIVDTIERNNITIMHFVPSMLKAFLEYVTTTFRAANLSCLRQVFASGETLTLSQVEIFDQQLNKPNGTRLANLYGPTEATVDVSYFNCPLGEGDNIEKIPIGKPIDNIKLYIVDKYLHLQPVGAPGELCISGAGLARGYLNNPGLTAEKFDRDLWNYQDYQDKNKKIPGKNYTHHSTTPPLTTYKTGDLARWLPDGNIEFLGRIDHQVKIRGFRIELKEIENQLLKHEKIEGAVVLLKEKNQDNYLCAYILSKEDLKIPDLREHLAISLPDYMIPSQFIKIDKIPVTPNGKLDRKSLLSYDTRLGTGEEYTPPKSKTEKRIAEIWKEVLNLDKVSIHDNIFDLGGDSFKIIKINSRIKDILKEDIPVLMLFRYSTIRSLSDYFTRYKVETIKMKTTKVEKLDQVEETMKDTIQLFDEVERF